MSPRERRLAAAVGALALLRALVAFVEQEPSALGRPLLEFDPAAVARVDLARGQTRTVLERVAGGEGWVVASHGGVSARAGAVDDLLIRLRGWRIERLAGRDPARHPEWFVDAAGARQVRLSGADGRSLGQVWVGKVTGIEADAAGGQVDLDALGLFVRAAPGDAAPGDETWVVNALMTRRLDPDARRWFVHPLLGGHPQEMRSLRLAAAGRDPVALRFDEPGVRFVPAGLPVDAARARSLALHLYLLEASGAAPEGAAPSADALRIVAETAEGAEELVLWRGEGGWLLDGPRGRVAVAAPAAEAVWSTTRAALVRRRLFPIDPLEARRLHVRQGDREWSLAADPRAGLWDAVATGAAPLRHRRLPHRDVAPLLEAVSALEVERWDAGEVGPPWVRCVVVAAGGRHEVAFGAASGGRCPATVGDARGWVSAAAVARLVEATAATAEGR